MLVTYVDEPCELCIIMLLPSARMRSEGTVVGLSVCLSVCLSVRAISRW